MKRPSKKSYRVGRSRTGLGLFAMKRIEKGTIIAQYWGRRVRTHVADDINSKYLFEVNSRWTVDGATRRNVARYINHGCRPNAEPDIIKGKIFIRAKKAIEPGDEITYNYGKAYFETFIEPIGCGCAACVTKRRAERAEKRRLRERRRVAAGKGKAAPAPKKAKAPARSARASKRTASARASKTKRRTAR